MASARRRLSFNLVRSPRRRFAGCVGPARQVVGSAGTGTRPGGANPAGNHSSPVNWSARSATPAARQRGVPSQQIAKAIAWLKQNFVETLDGDDLADRAHMSPSTFRQHFRALTGVSPLQYPKQLRLQEARQLMLNENLDACSAGGRVEYESPSQFSREYSRLFGAPPQRDVTRMRLAPVTGVANSRRTVARSAARGTASRHRSTRPSLGSR